MLNTVPTVSTSLAASGVVRFHAEKEDSCHRRGNETEHRLEDIEQIESLYRVYRNANKYRQSRSDDHYHTTYMVDVSGRRRSVQFLDVDVHREDRAQGVEC